MATEAPAPRTLMVTCSNCCRGINLWCEDWREGGVAQPIDFACPMCQANQSMEIPATRVSPSVRDDDPGTRIMLATIISGL